jgi:hypothetical protein
MWGREGVTRGLIFYSLVYNCFAYFPLSLQLLQQNSNRHRPPSSTVHLIYRVVVHHQLYQRSAVFLQNQTILNSRTMHPSMSSFMRNTNGDTDTAADPAAVGESGNEPDASHHNTAAESVAWSTEDDAKLMNAYRKANTINISSDGSTQIDYDDYKTWDAISQQMTPARTSVQCLLRYLKLNSKNIPNKKRKLDDTVTIEESAQKEVPAEETTGISTNLIRPSLWTEGETAQLKELMESYKGSC